MFGSRWITETQVFVLEGFALARFTITVEGAWTLTIDGQPVLSDDGEGADHFTTLLPLGPGLHHVEVSMRSAPDDTPWTFERVDAHAAIAVPVMTFNVKGDRGGRRGKELGCTRRFLPCGLDPGAIADEIVTRGARIVGLQEVGPRQADAIEAALIERTGARWQSVWELKHHRVGFGEDEGHAVYVRDGEIIGSIALQYSNAPAEFRHASSRRIVQYAPVRLEEDGVEHIVNVYVTHLQTGRARGAQREEEAAELVTWTEQDGPAVIFGDFNASPDEATYARMSARWDDVWLRGFPDANASTCDPDRTCGYTSTIHLEVDPNERIDYIWARGADVSDAAVRLEGEAYDRYRKLSDHMPLSATLRFTGADTATGAGTDVTP